MMCAWEQLLGIMPGWLSRDVDRHGKAAAQEIRLRLGQVPEINLGRTSLWLDRIVSKDDLSFVINTASRYSPWAAASVGMGYLTAVGGHRIGICGDVIMKEGVMTGVREVRSICIRVARDFSGVAATVSDIKGSVLVIGPPGSGKTTFLRDLSRTIALHETVGVVDERGELFPEGISRGRRMDVLSGCNKPHGIQILLRTMGPCCIAVDEITTESDCEALVQAGWCGVRLLATAHAASLADLRSRPVYSPLVDRGLFDRVIVMKRDKSWNEVRAAV